MDSAAPALCAASSFWGWGCLFAEVFNLCGSSWFGGCFCCSECVQNAAYECRECLVDVEPLFGTGGQPANLGGKSGVPWYGCLRGTHKGVLVDKPIKAQSILCEETLAFQVTLVGQQYGRYGLILE